MEQTYNISDKLKRTAGILAIVGLVVALIGVFTTKGDYQASRFWSSLLFNNLFFTWIALIGAFFIAAFGLGYSGWHTLIKRIPEAMAHFIFIGLPMILFIFFFGKKHLYEWTHSEIVSVDGILSAKTWWLNDGTFILFTLIWIFTMCFFFFRLRQNSLKLDQTGDYKIYSNSLVLSAVFLFFFAIMNSVSTWHWVMSVEPHWYSTLYGWYLFASSFVSGIAVMVIILILLKRAGFLPQVNLNHFHDLGKLLFAFSIFWTYLWFSQFMLIWYANIPEETIHFKYLLENHKFLFYLALILNFFVPLLVLMSRDAKRNLGTLLFISVVILFGHWIDFSLMIRPGTDRLLSHHLHTEHLIEETEHATMGLGLTEIGIAILYIGVFAFVTAWALSKAPLIPQNHPFERESIEHHI